MCKGKFLQLLCVDHIHNISTICYTLFRRYLRTYVILMITMGLWCVLQSQWRIWLYIVPWSSFGQSDHSICYKVLWSMDKWLHIQHTTQPWVLVLIPSWLPIYPGICKADDQLLKYVCHNYRFFNYIMSHLHSTKHE